MRNQIKTLLFIDFYKFYATGKAIEESKKNIVEKVVETLQKGREGDSDGEETNEQE